MEIIKLTPHQLAEKTIKDIKVRRKRQERGRKAADSHIFENSCRIKKRMASHSIYK